MSSEDGRYNGWANWETWNVRLWLDNDGHDPFDYQPPVEPDALREYVDETYGPDGDRVGPLSDAWGVYLQSVDWRELAESYAEDTDAEDTDAHER